MIPLQSLLKTLSATLISISVAYAQIPLEYTVFPPDEPTLVQTLKNVPQARISAKSRVDKPNAEVRNMIVSYAHQYGVSEYLALEIARCESNFDRFAKNKKSSAESTFQFIDGTWRRSIMEMGLPSSTSKFDERYSIEVAIWLLKKDGTRHWNESKNCWGKI